MLRKRLQIRPVADRGPLRVMWLGHSLPGGYAERRLRDVIRQFEGERFLPEMCCLRSPGDVGEELAREIPVHGSLRRGRFDLLLLPRLMRLFRRRRVDAVVTFGGEDVLFWGRLAAWLADVPVVLTARDAMGTIGESESKRTVVAVQDAITAAYERKASAWRGCHARPRRDTIAVE